MQVLVSHHRTALVPLPAADDVYMSHTKRISAAHNRPHIKVALHIIHRNLQAAAVRIKVGHNLVMWYAFIFIYYITWIVQ